jgi:hypothetical protein
MSILPDAFSVGDVQLRVVDLHASRRGDVGRGDGAGACLAQVHDDGLVLLGRQDELLDVEDDLGDVLDDAGQRGELVLVPLDLDADVTAAPGMDDSRVRRRELPRVYPKPGSRGSMTNRER